MENSVTRSLITHHINASNLGTDTYVHAAHEICLNDAILALTFGKICPLCIDPEGSGFFQFNE